ncbi:hypothetical protein NX722_25625 [Endozoicomonas gorgoniicola]|uniref:Transposase n=1 Tax=Endozoicomonas gorgoniicola TaxID=1234144 RepID=A0ABT3N2U3_9GAMM|nr:hypothetical protein [Endozoicomonas gorgoniicola]MCW7555947.1 hypothetical protein [Endozoicomonas gorgoniicola]
MTTPKSEYLQIGKSPVTAMPEEEFIINVYCLVDDLFKKLFPDPIRNRGFEPQTPFKKNMKDKRPKQFVRLIMRVRRRVETVIGQLAHYFDMEYSGCRNMLHMTARMARKLLAYNVGVFLNVQASKPATQFENLIAA